LWRLQAILGKSRIRPEREKVVWSIWGDGRPKRIDGNPSAALRARRPGANASKMLVFTEASNRLPSGGTPADAAADVYGRHKFHIRLRRFELTMNASYTHSRKMASMQPDGYGGRRHAVTDAPRKTGTGT
jgi:hypothetical protein